MDPSSDRCPQEKKLSCLRFIATLVSFPSSTFEVAMVVHSSICRVNHDKWCLGLLASWPILLCDPISIVVFLCIRAWCTRLCTSCMERRRRGGACTWPPRTCISDQIPVAEKGHKQLAYRLSLQYFLLSPGALCGPRATPPKCFRECINPNCG